MLKCNSLCVKRITSYSLKALLQPCGSSLIFCSYRCQRGEHFQSRCFRTSYACSWNSSNSTCPSALRKRTPNFARIAPESNINNKDVNSWGYGTYPEFFMRIGDLQWPVLWDCVDPLITLATQALRLLLQSNRNSCVGSCSLCSSSTSSLCRHYFFFEWVLVI